MRHWLFLALTLTTTIAAGQSSTTSTATYVHSETECLLLVTTWVTEYQKTFPDRRIIFATEKNHADLIISTASSTTEFVVGRNKQNNTKVFIRNSPNPNREILFLMNWIANEGQLKPFPVGFSNPSKEDIRRSQQMIAVALKGYSSPSCEGLSEVLKNRKTSIIKD